MITITYEGIKYVAAACMMAATLCMFNVYLASVSTIPWILYIVANIIWGYDSFKNRNNPWLLLSIGFVTLDVLLVYARLTGTQIQL